MARKLYILNVVGKSKTAGAGFTRCAGTYSTTYAYLGDFEARLLGLGSYSAKNPMPRWLHTVPEGSRLQKTLHKGGARRLYAHSGKWGGTV
jgi:hypothetical protein